MAYTRRDHTGISLVILEAFGAFAFWYFFFESVRMSSIGGIWQVIFSFFILAVFFFIGAVVWKGAIVRSAGVAMLLFPSFLFLQSWEFVLANVLAFLFLYRSASHISGETIERLRFHFLKSARAGKFLFGFSFALLLSFGYYVTIKDVSLENLIPRFVLGDNTMKMALRGAGMLHEDFSKILEEDGTVDEFLLGVAQKEKYSSDVQSQEGMFSLETDDLWNVFSGISADAITTDSAFEQSGQAFEKEIFLHAGREQIAQFVGQPITGTEKVSDVLASILRNKLTGFAQNSTEEHIFSSSALSFFLAMLLFLTLLSLVPIINALAIFVAFLLFQLLLATKCLSWEEATIQCERLAL
ncbi:MAG: hypothetical protein HYV45_01605 [Candidatus Moranbacteria bacterium]|nr:hypothetical protein [Candidatus Moranbacteria bacterium]